MDGTLTYQGRLRSTLRRLASPPYSGALLLLIPSLLYCTVVRALMIGFRADSPPLLLWTLLPALGLNLGTALTSLIIIDRLPVRRHRLFLGFLTAFLALKSTIVTLDALAVALRMTPITWIEYCQFFSNAQDLWPVLASVMTPKVARILVLSATAIAGIHVLLWRASCRRSTALRRTPPWSGRQLRPISATLALSVVAFHYRAPVDMKLRPLQAPGIERMLHGVSVGLQDRGALTWTANTMPLETPLEVRETDHPPFNIILFVLESTNRAATSLVSHATNGTSRESTPFLRHLADEGVEVANTYTVQSHTSKALVGILCGQRPFPDQQLIEVEGGLLNRCLPEVLGEHGYDTGFFQAPDLHFEDREGLARHAGFRTVRGGEELDGTGFERVNYLAREDRVVIKPAVDWVAQRKSPYMLTIMTSTTHHPYGSPGRPALTAGVDLDQARDHHQVSLRYVDGVLHSLLDEIDRVRGLKNTLVIVVGDHGESFGEHGNIGHDWIPYEEGVHVPLVMWGPDVLTGDRIGHPLAPGTRINGLRQQIDLMPTVLGLLDWQLTHGTLPGQNLFTSAGHPMVWYSCADASQCMGMRTATSAYIQQEFEEMPEVYDLRRDPGEQNDLAGKTPDDVLRMVQKQLHDFKRTLRARYIQVARVRGESEGNARLTALSKN